MIDRRLLVLGPLAAVTAALIFVGASRDNSPSDAATIDGTTAQTADPDQPVDTAVGLATATAPPVETTPSTTEPVLATVPLAVDDGKTSDERRLVDDFIVTDDELQPKSIVSSGDGLFFAQNMMYRHNVLIYDRAGNKVAIIPDDVDLAAFGVSGGAVVQGSPVEAAFTPDRKFVYVSNYKMFGPGYSSNADDDCGRGNWEDSYVYKIDVAAAAIVAVVPTGAVPKFLQVSPDGRRLVVSNWCGFDVSIIDTATDTELGRVDVGRHPRGVAIRSDSRYAYVTVMGEHKIDIIDLSSLAVVNTIPTEVSGTTPRHIVLSDDDQYLYVSNHKMNSVRKINLGGMYVEGIAKTGTQTRTLAISDDGKSLYVVNYQDGTVSKVRTSDMEILQTINSGVHPVGITYDADTRQVWVANYAGSLRVFLDE